MAKTDVIDGVEGRMIVASSKRWPLIAIFMIGVFCRAPTVLAAEESGMVLYEIVVYARKRPEYIGEVPVSLLTVSGEHLRDMAIDNLDELSPHLPNFHAVRSLYGSFIAIRGLGPAANSGFEPSVMHYSDDVVLFTPIVAGIPLMDLQRLEVLRGPQNVLFGQNSVGGAVARWSNLPTDTFEGMALAEYVPKYDTRHAQLVLSGPLSENLRGRLAVRHMAEEGYFDHVESGGDDPNIEQNGWRGTLSWDNSRRLQTSLKWEQFRMEGKGVRSEVIFGYEDPLEDSPYFGLNYSDTAAEMGKLANMDLGFDDMQQDYRRHSNRRDESELDVDIGTLKFDWMADDFTLTSISGYVTGDMDIHFDPDGSGIIYGTQRNEDSYRQLTQEFRLVSTLTNSFTWIAGLYYQNSDYELNTLWHSTQAGNVFSAGAAIAGDPLLVSVLNNFSIVRDAETDDESWAAYAQGSWAISPTVEFTLGGRFAYEDKFAARDLYTKLRDLSRRASADLRVDEFVPGLPGYLAGFGFPESYNRESLSQSMFSPAAIVKWDIHEDQMAYFSLARGTKGDGFDLRGDYEDTFEFDGESLWTAELGLKSRFAGGRAEVNAAVFYTSIDDMQVNQIDGNGRIAVRNADEATSQGAEVDGRWRMTEAFTLIFAAAYLDFEFDKNDNVACPFMVQFTTGEQICDYSGKTNIYSPRWSFSSSLAYHQALNNTLNLHASLDINYRDDHFVDVALLSDVKQDAYTRLDANLSLNKGQWTVSLFVKNITDETITRFAFEEPFSGSYVSAPAMVGSIDKPRTAGARLMYRF